MDQLQGGMQPRALEGVGERRQRQAPDMPKDIVRRVEAYRRRYLQYSAAVDQSLELQGVERHQILCAVAEDFVEDLLHGAAQELGGMMNSLSDTLVSNELAL